MKTPGQVIDWMFTRHRWVVHVLFWLLILAFYVVFFGRRNSNYWQTFFFVGLLMPVTISSTYVLNYYLVPRYLMKGRYFFFLLYFVYTMLGALLLAMVISMLTLMVMSEVNIRQMSPASFDVVFLLASMLMAVFLGVAIKMVLHWRESREDYQALMREKVEAELKLLKAQLNPHFLFNTLNNLYYLASEKSDDAPRAILALSEILDYVMHAGSQRQVALRTELEQVRHFVELELLRYRDRVTIEIHDSGAIDHYVIVPMTLITLMENAFKHGVMPSALPSWISLQLIPGDNGLTISLTNSVAGQLQRRGLGLDNLRHQLDLVLGERYALETSSEGDFFSANLTLRP